MPFLLLILAVPCRSGHPDLPDPIEGAESKHAQTLSLGFFDRRRGDGGGRPFGQPGAGPLS